MCNQMVMSEKGSGNFEDLEKTQVKIFRHFTSIPFDYLSISWATNYVSTDDFFFTCLPCLSWIVSIDKLFSLKRLELRFGLSSELSEFFDKIPVRIFLDSLFRVFRFSKALLIPCHLHS